MVGHFKCERIVKVIDPKSQEALLYLNITILLVSYNFSVVKVLTSTIKYDKKNVKKVWKQMLFGNVIY